MEAIGWVSSLILLLTIGRQVYKQWKDGTSEGISSWLFVGQIAASAGFIVYSWLLEMWIFVVANSFTLLSAIAGLAILIRNKKRNR